MRLRARLKKAFMNPSGFTLPQSGAIGPTDVTLSGRNSVEIVGCKALTAYEDCKISVAVKEGILTVYGEKYRSSHRKR